MPSREAGLANRRGLIGHPVYCSGSAHGALSDAQPKAQLKPRLKRPSLTLQDKTVYSNSGSFFVLE